MKVRSIFLIGGAALIVTAVSSSALGQVQPYEQPPARHNQEVEDAGSPREWLEKGNALFLKGEFYPAIYEYRRILVQSSEYQAIAHFNIGVCYQRLGKDKKAIPELREAVSSRKGHYPKALFALGISLEMSGFKVPAEAAYTGAIREAGGVYSEVLFRLGLLAQQRTELDRARGYYQAAIAQGNDNCPDCHNNLGIILAVQGNLKDAELEFDRAVTQSRGMSREALRNLVLCRGLQKAPPGASAAGLLIADARFETNPEREIDGNTNSSRNR